MSSDDSTLPFPGGWDGARKTDREGLPDSRTERVVAPPGDSSGLVSYRVRVDLDGSRPPIWRRLELAGDLSLDQLHQILQTAMGWSDSHLHQFLAGSSRDRQVEPFLTDAADEQGDADGIHERDVRLDQVIAEVSDRLLYEYDFGDGWSHTIRVEAIMPYDNTRPRATVTAGRRACPPEDCGGVWGYAELLDGLAAPGAADPDLQDRLEWMPAGFDPAAFSVQETNALLSRTLRSIGIARRA